MIESTAFYSAEIMRLKYICREYEIAYNIDEIVIKIPLVYEIELPSYFNKYHPY